MTDCFRKVSLVLLFLLAGTAMLPAVELITYITEIKTVREEQNYLYIKEGRKEGITLGMSALIYNPAIDYKGKRLVGRGKVVQVFKNITKVKIIEHNDKISSDGFLFFGDPDSEMIEEFQAEVLSDLCLCVRLDKNSKVAPVIAMVKEVIVEGNDNFIYARAGSKNEGFKVGLIGYLYADAALKERIGKVEVLEVYDKYSKLKVLEGNDEIADKAVVVLFEVDPNHYIK